MRGRKDFNFPAFNQAARQLRALGHEVFNPAERDVEALGRVPRSKHGDESRIRGFSLREALAADTQWIALHADGIAVLPGWDESKGAQAEVALAHALRLEVRPVAEWLETRVMVVA
jgi:hypothetical protein